MIHLYVENGLQHWMRPHLQASHWTMQLHILILRTMLLILLKVAWPGQVHHLAGEPVLQ